MATTFYRRVIDPPSPRPQRGAAATLYVIAPTLLDVIRAPLVVVVVVVVFLSRCLGKSILHVTRHHGATKRIRRLHTTDGAKTLRNARAHLVRQAAAAAVHLVSPVARNDDNIIPLGGNGKGRKQQPYARNASETFHPPGERNRVSVPLRVVRPNTYVFWPGRDASSRLVAAATKTTTVYRCFFPFGSVTEVFGKPFNRKIRRDVRTTPNVQKKKKNTKKTANTYVITIKYTVSSDRVKQE